MKLTLGFSTCPNDTFIFDAMIHQRIDTEGIEFDLLITDVEELNRETFKHQLDITKLSYHAFAYVSKNYSWLDSGSALGFNNGPLLISKANIYPDEVENLKIAIPGKFTTANLLLSIAYPKAENKQEYLFSDIEEAVLNNQVDAGLIIHENRFTYQEKGLKKIIDLGEFWQEKTQSPIPLGGIVVKRKHPLTLRKKINRIMKESVKFALENPAAGFDFVKQHAQEMNTEVMQKHINLYVNDFTQELGEKGKQAVRCLYKEASQAGVIPEIHNPIFVSEENQ